MIKLCLNDKHVIHANEHKQHVNCGLHVNFWKFWSMLFCLMMKEDHLKQNLPLWSQVFFKDSILILTIPISRLLKKHCPNLVQQTHLGILGKVIGTQNCRSLFSQDTILSHQFVTRLLIVQIFICALLEVKDLYYFLRC